MSLTAIPLETFTMMVGTITPVVYSPTAYTTPTKNTILSIGEITDSVDDKNGGIILGNVRIQAREDYSAENPGGFWYAVLSNENDNAEFSFTIRQGAEQPTFFFYGTIDRKTAVFTDHFRDGARITTVEFEAVAAIQKLQRVSVQSVIDVITNTGIGSPLTAINLGGGDFDYYISIPNLIACFTYAAFNPYNGQSLANSQGNIKGNDLQYMYSNSPYYLSDLYVYVGTKIGGATTWFAYYNAAVDGAWVKRFGNAFDVLRMIFNNFGIIPSYRWDGSSHKIDICTRGRSGSDVSGLSGKEKTFETTLDIEIKPLSIRSTFQALQASTNKYDAWIMQTDYYSAPVIQSGEPPNNNSSFEIDLAPDFSIYRSGIATFQALWIIDGGGIPRKIDTVKYWDYTASAWASTYTTANLLEEAIVRYLFKRFFGKRKLFRSLYGCASVNPFNDVIPFSTQTVNGQSCYAREIKKMLERMEIEIEWATT